MKHLAFLLLFCSCLVYGQALQLPPPPHAGWTPHAGAALPLDTAFHDEEGHTVQLREFFNDKPVVLVPGYFGCKTLCSTVFDDVVHTLVLAKMPPDAYQLVWFSIDPREDFKMATEKKQSYANVFPDNLNHIHLLTGDQPAINAVTSAMGFEYSYDRDSDQFAHPAGFVVVTPHGRVSRYFKGVQYQPRKVADAIAAAARGTGSKAWSDAVSDFAQQVSLLCTHYNPVVGRYSTTVMTGIRAVFLTAFVALLSGIWLRRRKRMGG